MAMIPCKECGQKISDRAPRCPVCGAPTGLPEVRVAPNGPRRWWIPLLVIWCLAIVSWFAISSRGRGELAAVVEQSHQPSPASTEAGAPFKPASVTDKTSAVPVYETTAEQLSQDYSANAVAIQNKISGRRIRVRGVVSAIDEDTAGHAVVKLRTSPSATVDFRLDDDQKIAAAQLVKGQAINVECGALQHGLTTPLASGCSLVPLQATGTTSYLAVLYSVEHGRAPLYIVGPISESTCAEQGEHIASQLSAPGQRLSKKCAATAQESMPAGECRLDSSMSSLPDMPDAHLWRYNCVAQGAVQSAALGTLGEDKPSARRAVTSNVVHKPTRSAIVAVPDQLVDAPIPATFAAAAAPAAAAASSPAVREEPTPIDVSATVATPTPVAVIASTPVPTAATPVPLTGGASAAAVTPAVAPSAAGTPADAPSAAVTPAVALSAAVTPAVAPSAAANLPPDLTTVDAKDPAAATRINSYCSKVTAAAANKDAVALGCRREEIAAWNRFAVQNEFPSLDDATRQKCNNPPFPDSYVAKEACAKYQLRVN